MPPFNQSPVSAPVTPNIEKQIEESTPEKKFEEVLSFLKNDTFNPRDTAYLADGCPHSPSKLSESDFYITSRPPMDTTSVAVRVTRIRKTDVAAQETGPKYERYVWRSAPVEVIFKDKNDMLKFIELYNSSEIISAIRENLSNDFEKFKSTPAYSIYLNAEANNLEVNRSKTIDAFFEQVLDTIQYGPEEEMKELSEFVQSLKGRILNGENVEDDELSYFNTIISGESAISSDLSTRKENYVGTGSYYQGVHSSIRKEMDGANVVYYLKWNGQVTRNRWTELKIDNNTAHLSYNTATGKGSDFIYGQYGVNA